MGDYKRIDVVFLYIYLAERIFFYTFAHAKAICSVRTRKSNWLSTCPDTVFMYM